MNDTTNCQCPACRAGELHFDPCAVHSSKLWRKRCNCGPVMASIATTGKPPEPQPIALRFWFFCAAAAALVVWLVAGAFA